MRIRKNTKLSSMLLATAGYGGDIPETYTCHLNQSPWDVIPASSFGDGELSNLLDSSWFLPCPYPSSSSSPSLIYKFNGDDSSNENVSLGDCNGTAERLNGSIESNHSLVSLERLNLTAVVDNYERSPDVEDPMNQSDYSDKNSKAVEPNSLVKGFGNDDQVAITTPAPPKRGRPRGTGKKATASTPATNNPYEFYYYSGFGPLWGRKRGGSEEEKIVMGDFQKSYEKNISKKSKSSSSSDEEDGKTVAFGSGSGSCDYVEEHYNDVVDEESDHGRKKKKEKMIMMKKTIKRGRKPVKERSLKSLM